MTEASEDERATPDDDRESPLTVARKWLPWCAALIFAMTLGWTALIAWDEVVNGNYPSLLRTAITVGDKVAPAAPAIVIYAIMVIGAADAIGGLAMVTYRYLENKWLKPMLEKQKEEAREEGREEGREEVRLAWVAWNNRRMEVEANGISFDEPPPAF